MTKPSISPSEVRFFSGSSNPQLAGDIAEQLGLPLAETHVSRFSNDNLYVQLGASVERKGGRILVTGTAGALSPPPGGVLDMGNSGTAMRLLAGASGVESADMVVQLDKLVATIVGSHADIVGLQPSLFDHTQTGGGDTTRLFGDYGDWELVGGSGHILQMRLPITLKEAASVAQ